MSKATDEASIARPGEKGIRPPRDECGNNDSGSNRPDTLRLEIPNDEDVKPPKEQSVDHEDGPNRPGALRLVLIFVALCLATLCCALDATIIATAIPTITTEFNSFQDYSWYNAAYLLCTCGFQLPFGRAYTLLSSKWTFVVAVVIFEIGSAVCGAAPSSVALIIGRAIQGLGASGIFGGAFVIIAENTPLRKRSLFTGFIAAMFGIASVVGPLLGGVFTDKVSWRWCFYINLPLGGITLVTIVLFLPASNKRVSETFKDQSWFRVLARFDPLGTAIIVPCIICLLLALQWGGTIYPWSDPTIIGLFVCFGVSLLIWITLQWWEGENATVPLSIIKQRTVSCATLYMLFGSASFTIIAYYVPLWFQSIRENTAFDSGIHTLPIILSVVVFAIGAGGLVAVVGYYVPFLILGTIWLSIGSALLMLLKPDSSMGQWIGYQVLFGAGVGASLEQCNIAVQTVLPEDKIPTGTSLTVFARSLGGSLSVAVAQSVFNQALSLRLSDALPNLNLEALSQSGAATQLLDTIRKAVGGDEQKVEQALGLYNHALTRTFMVGLVLACLTVLTIPGIEWKSVKKEKKDAKGKDEENGDEVGKEDIQERRESRESDSQSVED